MSSKKSGAQSSTDPEGIAQDSSEQDQDREQESPSQVLANALSNPAASGSGTIKVSG